MGEEDRIQKKYPCVYMRGGTSKGVFFHEKDLPGDKAVWPELFLKVMGSPDSKQIDGMGGTVSSTSKIAVVKKSEREGVDIDYLFCQVDVSSPVTDMSVNCGNLSSAVGPFAIDEGLVEPVEPVTAVKIFNTNTGKRMEEFVPVKNGRACVFGSDEIAGVPGTGAGITVFFEEPAGSMTGKLFPTGKKKEMLEIPGYGELEVSIIDCSHPVLFVRAEVLGKRGTELTELNGEEEFMERIRRIRAAGAVRLGFVERWEDAQTESAAAPDVALISEAQSYMAMDGRKVNASEIDFCARAVSMGVFHKAYPVTDSIAVSAAAKIEGTLVHDISKAGEQGRVRFGHTSGIMDVTIEMSGEHVKRAGLIRTARRIMDGFIYIR